MSGLYHEIDPSGDVVLGLSAQRRSPAETQEAEEELYNPEHVFSAVEVSQTCFKVSCFKVSSKHLILASKYFKDHFKKHCDPGAFLLVMNIIHGKNQEIPKEEGEAMLLKVADVACYLDCREACMFVVELWIERLCFEGKIRYNTWENCLKWAYLSWAFNLPSEFTTSTSAAMGLRSVTSKYPANLKLPELIKADITEGRSNACRKAQSILLPETTRLKSATVHCRFTCDSLHLGAILKATGDLKQSPLLLVNARLQSKVTHCTAAKPDCVNMADLLELKAAFGFACQGEGLILKNYIE
ncbi:hypothetical protein CNMCM5793_004319 [Aspergillus hiratsukae]|uniref:BTB domain-containing protein n=1 Tax=Aspergillus hiratsukae TaxID=1194566 RepID=A0A8H6P376_9EURO|nr:hypothetical protein CNMCM5793_004319 [Aspergillus hiratsukae]KAF7159268.1 hypothetical protein CNMCM6106_006403 [Aspergillus hiratsukae]